MPKRLPAEFFDYKPAHPHGAGTPAECARVSEPPAAYPLSGAPVERPGLADFQPLVERGISREVWEARGYIPCHGRSHPRYAETIADVRAELDQYAMSRGQRTTVLRFIGNLRDAGAPTDTFIRFKGDEAVDRVAQFGARDGWGQGLLMRKHPVPGAEPVLPQLRPHNDLRTGGTPIEHRHDRDFADNDEGRASLKRHIEKHHGGDFDFPANRLHYHERFAKYTITPRAREPYEHDHETDVAYQGARGSEKLKAHLRKHHGGKRCAGTHSHRRHKRSQHVADRLDIHPWAVERLSGAERVFFAIEGTPKADAILTKILAADAPASVFDCPSVTLWRAPELRWFAREYLRDKLVVIVPDADWHGNAAVVRQALLCRRYLEKRGIDACVAAPPLGANRAVLHKGVDDHLAAGGELDDLHVIDRRIPDGAPLLSMYADDNGQISTSIWTLVDILEVGSAEAAVAKLREYWDDDLIEIDRPLQIAVNDWSNRLEWENDEDEGGRTFPTITIRSDLRYREPKQPVRLGDYEHVKVQTPYRTYLRELSEILLGWAGNPSPTHIAEAKRRAAERMGKSVDQIDRDPEVRAHGKRWREIRRDLAQLQAAGYMGDLTPADLRLIFGVRSKTIYRDQHEERSSWTTTVVNALETSEEKPVPHLRLVPSDSQVVDNITRLENITSQFYAACHELAEVAENLRVRYPEHAGLGTATEEFQAQMREIATN